jgi:DNA polymerase III alpha subunit (gram-positive type)
MNKRIEYKRNPRYLVDKEALRYKSLIHNQQELKENEQLVECNSKNVIFRCNPKEVIFTNYIVNNYYQQELIVTNATNISQRLKVLHPSCV